MARKARRDPIDESPPEPEASSLWQRGSFGDEKLARGLLDGAVCGAVTSHDRRNVLWKIGRLHDGDPDLQFGIEGLTVMQPERVLALMAEAAGFNPDPGILDGPVGIDPERVLPRLKAAGDRLARAAARGERVLLATGHPIGLIRLYGAMGQLLVESGAKLVTPRAGYSWREMGFKREIRYRNEVATYCDRSSPLHTHSPLPMQHILREQTPDLVFADHGFAGAAIQAGVPTISIADVNDPAPVVAAELGLTEHVIVMDDNVSPDAYWPCFQAMASRFVA